MRALFCALFLALMFAMTACTSVGPRLAGTPDHHHARGFANPNGKSGARGAVFVMDRIRLAVPTAERRPAPPVTPQEAHAQWHASHPRDAVQWLGHASVRLRLAGQVIMIDPTSSPFASPLPPFGPIRASRPPLSPKQLGPADLILVTHNHYDHFQPRSVRDVSGPDTKCLMPLGVARYHRLGCTASELDWQDQRDFGPIRVTLMPAQHDSGRGLFDRDRALWGAYMLETGSRRIYVSGDTGYGPHFAQAARRGPIDLAIMNVGGYDPRHVNENVHITPEETIQAIADLGARRALVVHWGTYPLGLETGWDTYDRVRKAAAENGIPPGRILFKRIGDVAPL